MAGTSKRGLSATKSRSSGIKGTKAGSRRTPPTNTKRAPGPNLPGEKSVKPTGRTVGVKAVNESKAARAPARGAAVDRRRQIVES